MQVFVRRSSLTLGPDGVVPVVAYYEDATTITPEMRRPEFTLLSLPGSAIQNTDLGPRLQGGWREASREQIAYGEAERRILEAFPDHAQRNAALELGLLTAHHGDPSKWPKEAKARRAEIDRVFAYVNAIRQAAKGMAAVALAADPTADNRWPARISPYQAG